MCAYIKIVCVLQITPGDQWAYCSMFFRIPIYVAHMGSHEWDLLKLWFMSINAAYIKICFTYALMDFMSSSSYRLIYQWFEMFRVTDPWAGHIGVLRTQVGTLNRFGFENVLQFYSKGLYWTFSIFFFARNFYFQ